MNFGKWLLEKRKEQRLTQTGLGVRAGISTSYVSTLEREQPHGITNAAPQPTVEVVESIAKALNADIDEARLAAGYAPRNGSATNTFNLGENARVQLFDKNLSEEDQAEIAEQLSITYRVILERRAARQEKQKETNERL